MDPDASTPREKSILIVGGGLAGAFHAAASARRGHHVTLIDLHRPNAASRVAAGLFNIFTGREAVKTWLADEMLESLHAFLRLPQFQHLRSYFHFMPIYRPFPDAKSDNEWRVKLQHPGFEGLAIHHPQPKLPGILNNPLGGLQVLPCGWVEVGPLCAALLQTLVETHSLRHLDAEFDYSALDPESGSYQSTQGQGTYDEIVFAEGIGLSQNPWFQFVELRPLKGQILEVQMAPGLSEEEIVIRKSFLIPKGGGRFTVGSTYESQFEGDQPTQQGIETLSLSVKNLVALPFELQGARAAIRPTTPNRRPVLGRHPQYPRLAILNGLGTKGVLQAPLMAEQLRQWLDGEREDIATETRLERFLK